MAGSPRSPLKDALAASPCGIAIGNGAHFLQSCTSKRKASAPEKDCTPDRPEAAAQARSAVAAPNYMSRNQVGGQLQRLDEAGKFTKEATEAVAKETEEVVAKTAEAMEAVAKETEEAVAKTLDEAGKLTKDATDAVAKGTEEAVANTVQAMDDAGKFTKEATEAVAKETEEVVAKTAVAFSATAELISTTMRASTKAAAAMLLRISSGNEARAAAVLENIMQHEVSSTMVSGTRVVQEHATRTARLFAEVIRLHVKSAGDLVIALMGRSANPHPSPNPSPSPTPTPTPT